MRLDPTTVQLLVIDVQEKLFAAMPEAARARTARSIDNLLFVGNELGVPITITEQYPQGLGPTLPQLRIREPFQKMHFSAMAEPEFAQHLHRRRVVVVGMETHICVALTVADLREHQYEVAVVADGCCSRREEDWRAGLETARGLGAAILPVETVLFGMLGRAGTPLFKEVSRRIR